MTSQRLIPASARQEWQRIVCLFLTQARAIQSTTSQIDNAAIMSSVPIDP